MRNRKFLTGYLTESEKKLSNSELADKFAKEKNLPVNPEPLISACEVLDKMLKNSTELRDQGALYTKDDETLLFKRECDHDMSQAVIANFACKLGFYQNPSNPNSYVSKEVAEKNAKKKWRENIIDSTLAARSEKDRLC